MTPSNIKKEIIGALIAVVLLVGVGMLTISGLMLSFSIHDFFNDKDCTYLQEYGQWANGERITKLVYVECPE